MFCKLFVFANHPLLVDLRLQKYDFSNEIPKNEYSFLPLRFIFCDFLCFMRFLVYLCKLKIAIMIQVKIKDAVLRKSAEEGMDAFVRVFVQAIREAIGGELTVETMPLLNSDQITLLAWDILHEEMMDGGMIQLIHNGYGPFMFKNPTDKAFRNWGMRGLYKLINKSHALYRLAKDEIEQPEMTDEEFMELYEKHPEFDDMDDEFIENEEQWTSEIACYIDDHLENFAQIEE